MPELSRDKKEEFRTYANLGLPRTLKSRAQRRRVLARGAQIILGHGAADEPPILVRRDEYEKMRLEISHELLGQARLHLVGLSKEAVLDGLRPRLEREIYQRLAARQNKASATDAAFLQTHARRATAAERRVFAQFSGPVTAESAWQGSPAQRRNLVHEVLEKIEARQKQGSSRLQSAWAEVIGAEMAQQSYLERIDEKSGVAYFRCLNSALSYSLQRRPELCGKLTRKLGLTIRRLKAAY